MGGNQPPYPKPRQTERSNTMITETTRKVKFEDLDLYAKLNCMDQFVNIMCPYEDYSDLTLEEMAINIEYWLEPYPDQYWIDLDGNWYDEGRMVRI